MIKREDIRGDEAPRDLCRLLPEKVRSLRTVLVYKKVVGHPDPGEPLSVTDRPELSEDEVPAEDERLFEQRVKRSLTEVGGRASKSKAPMRRSRIFGA